MILAEISEISFNIKSKMFSLKPKNYIMNLKPLSHVTKIVYIA